MIYGILETERAGTKRTSPRRRNATGHAGPAHFANVDYGSSARPHNCPHHRAAFGRGPASRARLTLPGPAPARKSKMDCLVLGDLGEQSQSSILPLNCSGPQTTPGTHQPLGPASTRGESGLAAS